MKSTCQRPLGHQISESKLRLFFWLTHGVKYNVKINDFNEITLFMISLQQNEYNSIYYKNWVIMPFLHADFKNCIKKFFAHFFGILFLDFNQKRVFQWPRFWKINTNGWNCFLKKWMFSLGKSHNLDCGENAWNVFCEKVYKHVFLQKVFFDCSGCFL